jgi:hypothetical protein
MALAKIEADSREMKKPHRVISTEAITRAYFRR